MTGTITARGFAAQLRDGTRAEHERTETAPFIGALMEGLLPVAAYADYLGQLHAVYSALEDVTPQHVGDPTAAAFIDPALARRQAIEADLERLAGPGWRSTTPECDATAAYCDRVADVAATWPAGFVAHHYTRYLGDLSGGQVIGAAVRRIYGLDGHEGTRFFQFEQIASPKRYKDAYRARLDAVAWPSDERERVVQEACRAFTLNNDLFVALGTRHLPVSVNLDASL